MSTVYTMTDHSPDNR